MGGKFDLSLIMPCFNEENIVAYTIDNLLKTFKAAGCKLQLIAVDNGSSDQTGQILKELARQNDSVTFHRVEKNHGYGNGIMEGMPLCKAPWMGFIAADGQVDAEDVARLYEVVSSHTHPVLGKIRRRFRMDGFRRKIISVCYNLFIRLLWPRLNSWDINGTPKLMPANVPRAMDLKSKGWLLDPEIMVKAHYMGIPILEFNAFSRMRGGGKSHVGALTCWEFFKYILVFRFSGQWRKAVEHNSVNRKTLDETL